MKITVSISDARKNLFKLRAKAVNSNIPVLITHKDGNVVMMSEADYANIMEHLHLAKDKVAMTALAEAAEDRECLKLYVWDNWWETEWTCIVYALSEEEARKLIEKEERGWVTGPPKVIEKPMAFCFFDLGRCLVAVCCPPVVLCL